MKYEYYLVNKAIVPEYYESVIKAKQMVEGQGLSVSAACEACNISRSTYYKYKDYIALPVHEIFHRAMFSFRVNDEPGVLSSILNEVYKEKCNVLTINQEAPIMGFAYITLLLDMTDSLLELDQLVGEFNKLKFVKKAEVLSYE